MFRGGGGGVGGGAGRGTFKPPSFLQKQDSSGSSSKSGQMPTSVANEQSPLSGQGSASGAMWRGSRRSVAAHPSSDAEDRYGEGDDEIVELKASKRSRVTGEPSSKGTTPSRSSHPASVSGNGKDSSVTSPPHLSALVKSSSNGAPQAISPPRGDHDEEYYMCMWRKPQGRKHKTWDGDAVLIYHRIRRTLRLKCQESGRELGFSANPAQQEFSSGDEMTIGGKEIEIDRPISHREYLSGIPSNYQWPGSTKTLKQQASSRASPARPLESPTSRSRLMAPAPAASFYSTPLPKVRASYQTPEVVSSKAAGQEQNSAPAKRNTPLSNKSRQEPSSSNSQRRDSPVIQPRPHGLFASKDKPEPRYDPEAEGAVVMPRPSKEHAAEYNKRRDAVVDVVLNPVLSKELRPHQIEGVKFLYSRVMGLNDVEGCRGAILADEMGLGKTLQTITLVETLLRQSPYYNSSSPRSIDKALIVCPLSLVKNWQREFKKWLGDNGARNIGVVAVDGSKGKEVTQSFVTSKRDSVLIIGYEKLRGCIDVLSTAQPPIGLIVCDEGHRLKSKDAKTTKMFSQMRTDRRIILTGTPIQNDLSELYAMIDFVCPELLGDYSSFRKMFEEPILKSRMQYCSLEIKKLGRERSSILTDVTKLIVLRRTASILSGYLLPKSESVLFCAPTELQLELYRRILRSSQVRSLTSGATGGGNLALSLITLLRQVCDSPELLLKDVERVGSGKSNKGSGQNKESLASEVLQDALDLFPARRTRGDATLSGKLIAVTRMLAKIKDQTDDKIVLVSTFTATLDVLESLCKRLKYSYVRLDGKTKQEDRQALVNRFNSRPRSDSLVFLLSTKAGGMGLNLIGANRLVLMEPEWNPAMDQQAMARIHRDGQKKHCFIYRMMMSGTMDEKIFQRQIQKLGLSDTLMCAEGEGQRLDGEAEEEDADSDVPTRGKRKRSIAADTTAYNGADARKGKGGSDDTFTPEELKDIFTLHEDTPCLCHDLLMCTCGGSGASISQACQDAAGDDDEDEDDDWVSPPGFMPASQQAGKREADMAKMAKARLAGLADWRHMDGTRPHDARGQGRPSLEARLSTLCEEDTVLRALLEEQRLSRSQLSADTRSSQVSEKEPSSLLEQMDLDHLDAAVAKGRWSGDNNAAAGGWHVSVEEAGNILYVLQRQSGGEVKKAVKVSAGDEESSEGDSPAVEAAAQAVHGVRSDGSEGAESDGDEEGSKEKDEE